MSGGILLEFINKLLIYILTLSAFVPLSFIAAKSFRFVISNLSRRQKEYENIYIIAA